VNILLINGAEDRGFSKGAYNQIMSDTAKAFFETRGDTFVSTLVRNGYDNDAEVQKTVDADIII